MNNLKRFCAPKSAISEEIKKLREKEDLSLYEAKDIIERKMLFEQIEAIQTIEDVKKILEKVLHRLYRTD